VPTFAITPRFRRDLKALAPSNAAGLRRSCARSFVFDVDANLWRLGLRVKRVRSVVAIFACNSSR
jgi:hypothetical protein